MIPQAPNIVDEIAKAIQAEAYGQIFYLMAAETTQDERGKGIFRQLAEEEKSHQTFLKAQYHSLKEKGELDNSVHLGKPMAFVSANPIFSDAIKTRVKEAHFEMTALSVGAQLELSAVQFYKAAAGKAQDPKIKEFFNFLVKWEQTHYDALTRQEKTLKEEYWTGQGFSAF